MRLIVPLLLLSLFAAQAEEPARWWRGNLHTHSLWSDGDDYPEMIAAWYKERGYHFLGLSDHNIIADHEKWVSIEKNKGGQKAFDKYLAKWGQPWVETRESAHGREVRLKMLSELRKPLDEAGKFLLIPMEEITAPTVHVNATNIQEKILPYTGGAKEVTSESVVRAMQYAVGAVLEQRQRLGVPMFPHVNHPNFRWQLTAEEMMQVKDEQFFEVYNGHPTVYNSGDATHAGTERVWDIVQTTRIAKLKHGPLYGLATDDSHAYHEGNPRKQSRPGRGWVMVRAPKLEAAALVTAMEAGDFYASTGVTLADVRQEKDGIAIEIQAEPGQTYVTEFIGTRRGYNADSQPVLGEDGQPLRVTRRYSADIGSVLAKAEGPKASYTFKGDELYVRARVTSSKVKADPSEEGEYERAWTQPMLPRAARP